jgi:hypothetical protein
MDRLWQKIRPYVDILCEYGTCYWLSLSVAVNVMLVPVQASLYFILLLFNVIFTFCYVILKWRVVMPIMRRAAASLYRLYNPRLPKELWRADERAEAALLP